MCLVAVAEIVMKHSQNSGKLADRMEQPHKNKMPKYVP